MDAPSNGEESGLDIWERMDACLDDMSPKEQQVYKLVREQPNAFSSATATELAARFNIAQSTISRFCQRIGFSGFSEFRMSLALAMANYSYGKDRQEPAAQERHDLAYYMADIIYQTRAALPPPQLEALARRIGQATGVYVGGHGNSNPPARILFTRLVLNQVPVHLMESNFEIEMMHIIKSTDVVVLFSAQNPTHRDFVSFVHNLPPEARPYIVLVANTPRHPLRRYVNEVFCLPTWSTLQYPIMLDTALAPIAFCSFLNECLARFLNGTDTPAQE